MTNLCCNLQIHINGQHTFFLDEKIVSKFSGKLRKIPDEKKRRTNIKNTEINIDDFPGGPNGFELVSRFCYNNGTITLTLQNVSLLHCCALFLEMTEKFSTCNLLHQTETFLDGIFYWSWNDILTCLQSCNSFFSYAYSWGLVQKFMYSLLEKIDQDSDIKLVVSSSSPLSSHVLSRNISHQVGSLRRYRQETTSELVKSCSSNKAWWFDDFTTLQPMIIEKFAKILGFYGADNNSLVLTRFLLYYLKKSVQFKGRNIISRSEYSGLANTAIYGVISIGNTAFSFRNLFWVRRVVFGFGVTRKCRNGLERLIGEMLDQGKVDDLLVSGKDGCVYDVNLVLRLIGFFVHNDEVDIQKMKVVGGLIDKYLGEISPDQNIKMSKFLRVAESLPDCARDCFDGVYRAVDIYIETHPTLSMEERSKLCRCMNYEKLSLEESKDLVKNPRIPPRIALQALACQHSNIPTTKEYFVNNILHRSNTQRVLYNGVHSDSLEENELLRLNLQRMQWRVVELLEVCKDMKGRM